MVLGFNHSGFVVQDIDKMVSFYRDDLGLTVDREVDSKAPLEGDHTGIPGAHRTLVFVGKGGEHALELVYIFTPRVQKGTLSAISWALRTSVSTSKILNNYMKT